MYLAANSKATVGYMIEGPGAPIPILIISWENHETAEAHWHLLKRCNIWQLRAVYRNSTARLHLSAAGRPIPIGPKMLWIGGTAQVAAVPTYAANWKMAQEANMRYFMSEVREHGAFVIIAAINKRLCSTLHPITAHLRPRGGAV